MPKVVRTRTYHWAILILLAIIIAQIVFKRTPVDPEVAVLQEKIRASDARAAVLEDSIKTIGEERRRDWAMFTAKDSVHKTEIAKLKTRTRVVQVAVETASAPQLDSIRQEHLPPPSTKELYTMPLEHAQKAMAALVVGPIKDSTITAQDARIDAYVQAVGAMQKSYDEELALRDQQKAEIESGRDAWKQVATKYQGEAKQQEKKTKLWKVLTGIGTVGGVVLGVMIAQ